MATNVSVDQLADGMVAQLAPLAPEQGGAVSALRPFWFVRRYMGELATEEAQQRGVVGRTPCVLIAWHADKPIRTTIGRRVDKVETSLLAIVCCDSWRGRDDRSSVFSKLELVKLALGARRLGLPIQPLRFQGTVPLVDDEKLVAYAVRFSTRHHVDYTVAPASSPLTSVYGGFTLPDDKGGATIVEVSKEYP